MTPRTTALGGILLLCGTLLATQHGWAQLPIDPKAPVPGYYLGAESRGYPYYPGYRDYPGYPLYRGYPDYFGYPCYPRKGFAPGYQPANSYILEFFGLRPAIWRFTDYYSGTFPSYYRGVAPDFRSDVVAPPPGVGFDSLTTIPPEGGFLPHDSAPSYPAPETTGGSPPESVGAPGRIIIHAPRNAEVSFNGWKTTMTAEVRPLRTLPLEPGKVYSFDVAANWQENGQPVSRKVRVLLTSGQTVDVQLDHP